jgi:hypothetical protein
MKKTSRIEAILGLMRTSAVPLVLEGSVPASVTS